MKKGGGMKVVRAILLTLILLPVAGVAQNTNQRIENLNRTVAQLEDTVARMKTATDEKLIEIKLLLQQTLESANKANTSVTIFEGQIRERLLQQEKSVATPLAGLSTRTDSMEGELRNLRETLADMNIKLGRLENRMVDIDTAVKTIQTPPPPPPGTSTTSPSPNTPPPGTSSEKLFQDAYRDKLANNTDIALEQFQLYLRWFPTTANACMAQYYAGEIYYNKAEYEQALQAFDAVLEKYPADCDKAPAQFQKALTLGKLGKRKEAAEELYALRKKNPTGTWARKVAAALKDLGYPTTPRGKD
jgi:TolA-binding protein